MLRTTVVVIQFFLYNVSASTKLKRFFLSSNCDPSLCRKFAAFLVRNALCVCTVSDLSHQSVFVCKRLRRRICCHHSSQMKRFSKKSKSFKLTNLSETVTLLAECERPKTVYPRELERPATFPDFQPRLARRRGPNLWSGWSLLSMKKGTGQLALLDQLDWPTSYFFVSRLGCSCRKQQQLIFLLIDGQRNHLRRRFLPLCHAAHPIFFLSCVDDEECFSENGVLPAGFDLHFKNSKLYTRKELFRHSVAQNASRSISTVFW